jgi:N-acetylglucosamine-6-sulfatase
VGRTAARSATVLLAAPLLAALAGIRGCGPEPAPDPPPRPNIVVVMTDDQRWDELSLMPAVMERLVARGTSFSNSFVTTSLCCPSRASFLSGLYAHHHGIVTLGGAPKFRAVSTVAVWLDKAGYRTALIGKYMNNNGVLSPRIPPGWDVWRTFADRLTSFSGPALYYDYELNEDGTLVSYGDAPEDYSTDVLAAMAVDFVRGSAHEPFFLVYTPFGPHAPPLPAPRHEGAFASLEIPVRGDHPELDVSDKPSHVRENPGAVLAWSEERARELERVIRSKRIPILESLLAVDEGVAAILDAVEEAGVAGRTVVIFTSDNGFMWSEHWVIGKLYAYEESIRVPLVIRDPRRGDEPRTIEAMALNIDLAPTIAELAGVALRHEVDGRSLGPLLRGEDVSWREDFLIELPPHKDQPAFAAVRTERWKYIRNLRGTVFEELYDLERDPLEFDNLLVTNPGDPTVMRTATELRARAAELIGLERPPEAVPASPRR